MGRKAKPDPEKFCAECGTRMNRKRINGRLEDLGAFLRRRYCDRICMARAQLSGDPSSTYLKRFRKDCCEECGSTSRIGVHHIDGDRTNNSPENLRTLCPTCHTAWHWANGKTPWRRHSATCVVCGKVPAHSGLCATHRTRLRRHGSPCLTMRRIGSIWQLVEDRGPQNGRGLVA